MEELFKTVLSMSIGAGVLAAMVLIVRAVIGRRQTVVLTILFAMLIAKLVVPLSIESDASIFNLLPSSISQPAIVEKPIDAATTSVTTNNYAASSDSQPTLEHETGVMQDATTVNEVVSDQSVNLTANTTVDTVAPKTPAQPLSPWQIAAIVWLCGMAALIAVITASNVAFIRKVNRNRAYTSPGFDELLRSCANELGVKHKIRAVQMSDINTVAVCGIFRPKLLVSPETFDNLTIHEKRSVLMHELSHIKRKDTLTCLIITVVNILHWFNPIVWAAFAVFRKDIEVMCDAKVLRKMDNASRRSYANTLFTLAKSSGKTNTCFAMALFMSKATIKRRIAMIAKYKKNSPLIIALALILAVGIAITGCTTSKTIDGIVFRDITSEIQELELYGTYTLDYSRFTDNEDRVYNIKKAASKLNGVHVESGEQISLLDTLGPITEANGWKKAPGIDWGTVIQLIEIGNPAVILYDEQTSQIGGGIGLFAYAFCNVSQSPELKYNVDGDIEGLITDADAILHNRHENDIVLQTVEKDSTIIVNLYCEYNWTEEQKKQRELSKYISDNNLVMMSGGHFELKQDYTKETTENIKDVQSKIGFIEIAPGETVSLRELCGYDIKQNETVEEAEHIESGCSGSCMVATAIYKCALNSGLKIEEVTHHKNLPEGMDGGFDVEFTSLGGELKIRNPYDTKVVVQTEYYDGWINSDTYGPPMEHHIEFFSIDEQGEPLTPQIHFNTEYLPNGEKLSTVGSVSVTIIGRTPSVYKIYKQEFDLLNNLVDTSLINIVEYEGYPDQIYVNGDSYSDDKNVYLNIDINEIDENNQYEEDSDD